MIEDVDKCDGEARANNRKGKLIFFYEWEIALKWKGDKQTTYRRRPNIILQVMLMVVIKRLLARLRSQTCLRNMTILRMLTLT